MKVKLALFIMDHLLWVNVGVLVLVGAIASRTLIDHSRGSSRDRVWRCDADISSQLKPRDPLAPSGASVASL
jgi:hypothetical protein